MRGGEEGCFFEIIVCSIYMGGCGSGSGCGWDGNETSHFQITPYRRDCVLLIRLKLSRDPLFDD